MIDLLGTSVHTVFEALGGIAEEATVYTQVLKRFKNFALAPLTPQSWGEPTLSFGFLPPILGGQCIAKRFTRKDDDMYTR